ncbi:MAG: hypothetical protein JNN05_07045, partial [Candidatus Omnitrophica bacterium]|nr:hypothetical protein [Candidatus Omnitrophota bacterium]
NGEPNVNFQGTVALDLNTQAVSLKDFDFNADLSKLPLVKMKAELAPLKDVKLPETLSGLLSVKVKRLSAGPKGLGDFVLDANLQNGQVNLKEVAPQTNFAASQINLNISNFSLAGPFAFALKMAYLNPAPDIDVQGTATVDMKTQSVRLQDFTAGIDLGMLSLSELKANVGALKATPLPEVLDGKLMAMIKNLEAGSAGLKTVAMDLKLQNGRVVMKDAAPGISINAKDINLDVKEFGLDRPFGLRLGLAYLSDVPNIQFDGRVSVDLSKQAVGIKDGHLGVDLSKLNFGELKSSVTALATVPLPQAMAGDLKVTINDLNAGAAGLLGMLVDVSLENAAVELKDVSPGVNLQAYQIGLSIKDVSLDKKPMSIRLKAAYLSDQPNLDFTGTAVFDVPQSAVEVKDALFKTDLSLWSMEKLKSSVAALKDVSLPTELKGLLNVQIDMLAAGPKGMSALQSRGDLTAAVIKLKELKLPVNISQLKFQADGTNAKVDDLVVSLGKGTIKAKAAIDQYLVKPILHQELTVEGLDLDEVLEQKDAPIKALGLLYASMKIDGDPSNLNSLSGNGTFELKDGKLKGLNVIKTVFDSIKLPMLPNLSGMVMSALPEEYKKQFEKPDTDLKSVTSTMTIAQGAADLSVIDVQSDLFAFHGTGKAGFDQSYAVNGSFNITKDLSDLLVRDLENPFSYMRNGENLVSFPVHVKGKGAAQPKFEVEAIVKDVLKNAVQSKGKEELGRFVDKLLNKNGIQTQSPPSETPPQEGDGPADQTQVDQSNQKEAPQKSAGEQLIEGVFGTILK